MANVIAEEAARRILRAGNVHPVRAEIPEIVERLDDIALDMIVAHHKDQRDNRNRQRRLPPPAARKRLYEGLVRVWVGLPGVPKRIPAISRDGSTGAPFGDFMQFAGAFGNVTADFIASQAGDDPVWRGVIKTLRKMGNGDDVTPLLVAA